MRRIHVVTLAMPAAHGHAVQDLNLLPSYLLARVSDRSAQRQETGIMNLGEEVEVRLAWLHVCDEVLLAVLAGMHRPIPGVAHALAHLNRCQVCAADFAVLPAQQMHLHTYMIAVLWRKVRIEDEPVLVSQKP